MKKPLIMAGLAVVFASCNPAVIALDFMGPPSAEVGRGRFSVGADYASSDMDMRFNDGSGVWRGLTNGVPSGSGGGKAAGQTIGDIRMHKVYATIGYGITDRLDAFMRLGGASVDWSRTDLLSPSPPANPCCSDSTGFEGDTGFAIGFGSKVTFSRKGNIKWGGLFQVSWARSDSTETQLISLVNSTWMQRHEMDAMITEIQVAVGPTVDLSDGVSVYGGPFFHFIDGRVTDSYNRTGQVPGATTVLDGKYRYDLDQSSIFGGYIGAQIKLIKDVMLNIEYQHTAAADAVAMGVMGRL